MPTKLVMVYVSPSSSLQGSLPEGPRVLGSLQASQRRGEQESSQAAAWRFEVSLVRINCDAHAFFHFTSLTAINYNRLYDHAAPCTLSKSVCWYSKHHKFYHEQHVPCPRLLKQQFCPLMSNYDHMHGCYPSHHYIVCPWLVCRAYIYIYICILLMVFAVCHILKRWQPLQGRSTILVVTSAYCLYNEQYQSMPVCNTL